MVKVKIQLLLIFSLFSLQVLSQNDYDKLLIGNHKISLQWISWENFGTALIEKTDKLGVYKITGKQVDDIKSHYLKIEGNLKPLNEKLLLFEGKIETRIGYINGGESCLREGTFHFRISGERKYWRLKEMTNPCDSGNLVDYIDIFQIN